jgi:hypothetical protein
MVPYLHSGIDFWYTRHFYIFQVWERPKILIAKMIAVENFCIACKITQYIWPDPRPRVIFCHRKKRKEQDNLPVDWCSSVLDFSLHFRT